MTCSPIARTRSSASTSGRRRPSLRCPVDIDMLGRAAIASRGLKAPNVAWPSTSPASIATGTGKPHSACSRRAKPLDSMIVRYCSRMKDRTTINLQYATRVRLGSFLYIHWSALSRAIDRLVGRYRVGSLSHRPEAACNAQSARENSNILTVPSVTPVRALLVNDRARR